MDESQLISRGVCVCVGGGAFQQLSKALNQWKFRGSWKRVLLLTVVLLPPFQLWCDVLRSQKRGRWTGIGPIGFRHTEDIQRWSCRYWFLDHVQWALMD